MNAWMYPYRGTDSFSGSDNTAIENAKPCPFCGTMPLLEHTWSAFDDDYAVYCPNRGCPMGSVSTGYMATPEHAISAWNRRFDENLGKVVE